MATLLLFTGVAVLISCSDTGKGDFQTYRVFPVQKQLKLKPGSQSFLAVGIEIPSGSYIYGNPKGPGTGKPTVLRVRPVDGITFSVPRYLPPEQFNSPGEDKHVFGYSDRTTLFLPLNVNEDAEPGIRTLEIEYESLICSDRSCVPRDGELTLRVEVIQKGPESIPGEKMQKLFQTSSPPSEPGAVTDYMVDDSHESTNEGTSIRPAMETPLTGLTDRRAPQGKVADFTPRFLDTGTGGILQAILFGLIAGLILNFMPCVLPVVSIKIMGIIGHAEKEPRESTLLGMLFSLGILVSFAVLALLAAFFGYNWGGLFQHREFIVAMTAIVFILALSLFGVFTIQIPGFAGRAAATQGKNAYLDAFIKGLLATLLATPCSGPFLGGTLAWALTQPPSIIFIIFMSIGLGMALPYMIITARPALIRFIPKPGPWMVYFEKIMGFLLVFTVVYLLSILEGEDILATVTFLSITALAFWQFGTFASPVKSRKSRLLSLAVLIILLGGGYHLSFQGLYQAKVVSMNQVDDFSMETLLEEREAGRIVLVDFTADWCPNCKLVEATSLKTSKVRLAMEKHDAILLVADITRSNREAERLMESLGSRSIPFLAVFPPGETFRSPYCLRDIYSEDDVLRALEASAKER
jgi:thiol:disulfide interchange protein DsbD